MSSGPLVGDVIDIAGVSLNAGTVRSTLAAAAIVIGMAVLARRRIRIEHPSRIQLTLETAIEAIEERLGEARPARPAVVPLALALAGFIMVANLVRILPATSAWLPNPAADLNLTIALAVIVVAVVNGASIRHRGLKGYLRHYISPHPALLPIRILEELTRPVVLALRLFGTAFAGGMVLAVIAEVVPPAAAPLPHAAWALFDLALGGAQAVIYPLLAVLYYQAAVTPDQTETPTHKTLAPGGRLLAITADGPNLTSAGQR